MVRKKGVLALNREKLRSSFTRVRRLSPKDFKKMSKADLLKTISSYRFWNDYFRAKVQDALLENSFLVRKVEMLKKRINAIDNRQGMKHTFTHGLKSYKKTRKVEK